LPLIGIHGFSMRASWGIVAVVAALALAALK
jgi:hypothetical protein